MGRGVRPHPRRAHPAAQLRWPQVPAPGARGRPHRPGDDPHAPGPRRPPGYRRAHGVHRRRAPEGRRARRRGLRLRPRARALPRLQGERRGARLGRHRARVQGDQQQLGVHRRRAVPRLPGGRRADRHGVRPVPPDRHGLAAVGEGHPGHRGRAGRGGRAAQQRRPPLHVRRHPRPLQAPDRRQRGRGLDLHPGRQGGPPAAGASHPRPRGPLHRARDQGGARQPPRGGLPRHLLDQVEAPERRRAHPEEAAEHVPPVQAARRHRHHRDADGGRPDHPLRHGRGPGRRRLPDVDGARAVCGGRGGGRPERRQPARRQLALGPARLRQARRRVRRGVLARAAGRDDRRPAGRRRRVCRARAAPAPGSATPAGVPRASRSTGRGAARPPTSCSTSCRT